jgi:2-methylfumaryl-CoA isomerase
LVKLSLADIALMAVSNMGHIGEAQINGAERPRYGNDVYGAYGHDFATSDGRRMMVVGITTRQWRSLLAATETAASIAHLEKQRGLDFADEGQRFEARHDITAILTPWFAGRTMAQAGVALDGHDVCWGPYQSFQQLVAEDRRCSTDNPMFEVVDHPELGEFLMNGSALGFSQLDRVPVARAPLLGEHTDEILDELLGLGEAEIGRLHDRGIVAGANQSTS